jgi:hypothetical protein
MKGFLFDENLPARLRFSPGLPLIHATKVGRSPSDSRIWEYARRHDLAIVSKDADFSDRLIANLTVLKASVNQKPGDHWKAWKRLLVNKPPAENPTIWSIRHYKAVRRS